MLHFVIELGEHKVADIRKLLKNAHKFHLVVGARSSNALKQTPVLHRIAKYFINQILSFCFNQPVKDINSGLRVFNKDAIKNYFSLICDSYSFTASMTLIMLFERKKIKFIPIDYSQRKGKSKIKQFSYSVSFIKSFWVITKHYLISRTRNSYGLSD